MDKLKPYMALGLLAALLLLVIAMMCAKNMRAHEVVVFDKGRLVTSFAKKLESYQGSEVQKSLLLKKFSAAIPKGLARFAKEKGNIILPKQHDIFGAKDVTDSVSEMIAYCMKEDC